MGDYRDGDSICGADFLLDSFIGDRDITYSRSGNDQGDRFASLYDNLVEFDIQCCITAYLDNVIDFACAA